ncbi:MAG: hypothetical protein N3B18_09465 [Desulfobacterota bacterium]|nr:hypothetical protein [Thermodesulfobacteriota bacterium]
MKRVRILVDALIAWRVIVAGCMVCCSAFFYDACAETTLTGAASEVLPPHNTEFITSTAFMLAGMKTPHCMGWEAVTATKAWQQFASSMDTKWKQFFATRGHRIATWRRTELADIPDNATIFYPFSGPDFLYLSLLFPTARHYVLIGLEPVGTIPHQDAIGQENIARCLADIESSLEDILRISFFKTNDMSKELTETCLTGALPVLMIFLARTSHTIHTVQCFDLADNGTIQYRSVFPSGIEKHRCRGVEIRFSSSDNRLKTLTYLSANLSDNGLNRCPGCVSYFDGLAPPLVTFVKSASYLMHKPYFSRIRNFILHKSRMVLQDDSGIPYRFFDNKTWNVKLYGMYTGPIDLFKAHFEQDLAAAYRRGAASLPFRFGYNRQSNMLRAIKINNQHVP